MKRMTVVWRIMVYCPNDNKALVQLFVFSKAELLLKYLEFNNNCM